MPVYPKSRFISLSSALTAIGLLLAGACERETPNPQTAGTLSADAAAETCREDRVNTITIDKPWVREAGAGRPVSAAYMIICNTAEEDDALVAVSSDASAATEIHEMGRGSSGQMEMRPVSRLRLASGTPVTLAPGGLHIMLIDLNTPLNIGDTVTLTFRFENAEAITMAVPVKSGDRSKWSDTDHDTE